ncbi:unnamed protein product [Linum trigynum]|uniref:Uncharacterized protein n=1 Tax=Linum trigynum TaxID=586398 RepID=A0AAV2GKN5_9ROSI
MDLFFSSLYLRPRFPLELDYSSNIEILIIRISTETGTNEIGRSEQRRLDFKSPAAIRRIETSHLLNRRLDCR